MNFFDSSSKTKMVQQSTTWEKFLDAVAVAAAVGSLVQLLPSIAALFTIIWTGIRIWETRTVQGWFGRKPAVKKEEE